MKPVELVRPDPGEVEKLIGGYATGTLTDVERQRLFDEALRNQVLFDALADEEALRELLADPLARRRLLSTLERRPASLAERLAAWFFRPMPMTVATGVAAVAIAVVLVPRLVRHDEPIVQTAMKQVQQPVEQARQAAPQPVPLATPERPVGKEAVRNIQPKPAQPAPIVEAPRGEAASGEPAKERDEAGARVARRASTTGGAVGGVLGGVIGGAPPSVATPLAPPPIPAAPPPPPPAQRAEEAKLASSVATMAKVSIPAPPFEYRLERQGPGGIWSAVQPGTSFDAGDAVRLAVQTRAAGSLMVSIRSANEDRTLYGQPVQPGMQILIPAQGGLPTQADRTLVITHSLVAPPSVVSSFREDTSRRQANAPAGARAQSADEVRVNVPFVQAPYIVQIPLRFR